MHGVRAAEALVDLLLEMGRALFEKKLCEDAMIWLRRGYEILQLMDLGLMSPDAGELRLCLMHTYGLSFPLIESGQRLTNAHLSKGSAYE